MTYLAVVFVLLLTLITSEAIYVWTEWSKETRCMRSCSKPLGTAFYRRKCMKCADNLCKSVDNLYCGGYSEKKEICYVGTQCYGQGYYHGEWTEWSSLQVCPSVGERCKGEKIVSYRRCLLPAAYGRRLMFFRCPGYASVKKVESCPCQMSAWSEWSEWTICSPLGNGKRSRQRVCIRKNGTECIGETKEEAFCPSAQAFSEMGRPRSRKVRIRRNTISDKEGMRRISLAKSFLSRFSNLGLPGGFGGVLGCMFISLTIFASVVVIFKKRKARKAKKKQEAEEKNPDWAHLLAPYDKVSYRPQP